MPLDTDTWKEIRHLVNVLESLQIPYVIGGSMASSSQGAPRSTNDADVMVANFSGREQQFAAAFGEGYYISLPAVVEANRRHRSFNVIHTATGFKLDIFIEKPRSFDKQVFGRAELRRLSSGSDDVSLGQRSFRASVARRVAGPQVKLESFRPPLRRKLGRTARRE
jgi:hypothetical protein